MKKTAMLTVLALIISALCTFTVSAYSGVCGETAVWSLDEQSGTL